MNHTLNDKFIDYLSYNILYLRKSNNISKKEMAEILGIGISSLSKIEKGILPPRLSVEILFKIKNCFGIPFNIQIGAKLEEANDENAKKKSF